MYVEVMKWIHFMFIFIKLFYVTNVHSALLKWLLIVLWGVVSLYLVWYKVPSDFLVNYYIYRKYILMVSSYGTHIESLQNVYLKISYIMEIER